MFEDGEEISELDIESRTWNKLERNIKSIGFREGAAKGKELSLQEGFNLGYLEGFKLGECLGKARGILSGQSELKLTLSGKSCFKEETFYNLSGEICILCSKEKMFKTSTNDKIPFEKFEDLISMQHNYSSEMLKNLSEWNLHDIESNLDSVTLKFKCRLNKEMT